MLQKSLEEKIERLNAMNSLLAEEVKRAKEERYWSIADIIYFETANYEGVATLRAEKGGGYTDGIYHITPFNFSDVSIIYKPKLSNKIGYIFTSDGEDEWCSEWYRFYGRGSPDVKKVDAVKSDDDYKKDTVNITGFRTVFNPISNKEVEVHDTWKFDLARGIFKRYRKSPNVWA